MITINNDMKKQEVTTNATEKNDEGIDKYDS